MAEEKIKNNTETEQGPGRFPELEELQREIDRRLRDNRRFLEKFLDDDFVEEEGESDQDGEDFEEL